MWYFIQYLSDYIINYLNFGGFSEISKNEDTLKEYMLYKQFLDSLTPQASINFFFNCIFGHFIWLIDRWLGGPIAWYDWLNDWLTEWFIDWYTSSLWNRNGEMIDGKLKTRRRNWSVLQQNLSKWIDFYHLFLNNQISKSALRLVLVTLSLQRSKPKERSSMSKKKSMF